MRDRSEGAGGAAFWLFVVFAMSAGLCGSFASERRIGLSITFGFAALFFLTIFRMAFDDFMNGFGGQK